MELTKKLQEEVMQLYDTWFNSYLTGDVKTYDHYFDDDYHFIGSTGNEDFLNRRDTTKFFEVTADQLADKTDLRNSSKTIELFGELIFITQLSDAWFLNGTEWAFYGRFRFTSVLRKNKEGWRFIYQHFSTPDLKATEGETIGYEKISAENLELREAVKRRTIELEQKNRELEIETALEKVRARSLAMYHTSELQEIVNVVSQQLQQIGVNSNGGVFITINKDADQDLELWASSGMADYVEKVYIPVVDKPIFTELREAIKKGNSFFEKIFTKDEKDEMFRHLFQFAPWNALPPERKEELLSREGGLTRTAAISNNTSVVITNHNGKQFSAEEKDILKRFGYVFEQAYTRFLDLQKAEAQTREAQIEAALEKVRSRSLAMHKSNEIGEVIWTVIEKMKDLDIKMDGVSMVTYVPDSKDMLHWHASTEHIGNSQTMLLPYFDDLIFNDCVEAKEKGIELFTRLYSKEEKNNYFKLALENSDFKNFPEDSKQWILEQPYLSMSYAIQSHSGIFMEDYSGKIFSKEENNILIRFSKVFDQAYTRFLDLQKAEAQTREAQIETAVEKVRAQSMAMYKTSDLYKVNEEILSQLNKLTVTGLTGVSIYLVDENDIVTVWDLSSPGNISNPNSYSFKYDAKKYPILGGWVELWKTSKEDYFVLDFPKQVLIEGINEIEEILPEMAVLLSNAIESGKLQHQWSPAGRISDGILAIDLTAQPTEDTKSIVSKMAGAFNLAYQRFLDLQKAEAQTREAIIEGALERVRSRSMAMHKSNDVMDVAVVVYDELQKLDFKFGAATIIIMDEKTGNMQHWLAGFIQKNHVESYQVNNIEHPLHAAQLAAWRKGDKYVSIEMSGPALKSYAEEMFTQSGYINLPDEEKAMLSANDHAFFNLAYMKQGAMMWAPSALSDENAIILQRFAKVFEQTYTRFLDLQKAEAQAREAQIQLALERVRARTMAMQKQEDLFDVATAFGEQLVAIGLKVDYVSFMDGLISKKRDWNLWGCVPGLENSAQNNIIPYRETVYFTRTDQNIDAYEKTGNPIQVKSFTKEEKNEFLDYYFSVAQPLPEDFKKFLYDSPGSTIVDAFLSEVTVSICKYDEANEYTNEQLDIFNRFSQEFRQAYIRFLDLQKAEAQAREAQLEASLEKVRSVAMSMHHSNELLSICEAIYAELIKLGITELRNTMINIHNDAEETFLNYDYSAYAGRTVTKYGYHIHPMINHLVMQCRSTHDAFIDIAFAGEEFEAWRGFRKSSGEKDDKRLNRINHLHYYFYSIGIGSIGISTFESIDERKLALLKRFRNVFQLAYQRFTDLTAAEAQAREAKIEGALEKVRSRTLAMQKSDELAETAAVLFQQLMALGIAPNRLFIIIMKDDKPDMEAWLTDEDGSKVSMGFTGNYNRNGSILKMYEGWKQKKKSLIIDMQGKELQKYFHYLHDEMKVPFKGGLEQKRRMQHIAYFSHGLIGMASPDEQPIETMQLLERFAAVFNLTFTRFNDLKIAEAHALQAEQDLISIKEAKQKAEDALTNLQAAQKQLIQSEKMASLGELTAGIAHEIQNPLNFVNNFSEVSKELLDEMNDELEKGNLDDVRDIMKDVIQNLEKINHHGIRAADIVKGMLQHSRSSSGTKEPTDINALCDEYLRLSYHGLRAKDKNFNATLKTDFDVTLEKVSIIPQDIGRVVLNLLTNAFYAVGEKSSIWNLQSGNQNGEDAYTPTVSVSTKKIGEKVEIEVSDNGGGIPQKILDKIFQPFFTTKPSGQGTGLGLSLSYDIVKAHGGELKVETKEGEGTEFKIII